MTQNAGNQIFPTMPTALRTQMLWGRLASGVTARTGTNPGGYSVSRSSAGVYVITFGTSFSDAGYYLGLGVDGTGTNNHKINESGRATGSVTVNISAADVLTDLAWNFLAIGAY